MKAVVGVLAAVGLGLAAGAMLAEGAVLVPWWRSLPAESFLRWYADNGARLFAFFGPLEIASAGLAVAAAAPARAGARCRRVASSSWRPSGRRHPRSLPGLLSGGQRELRDRVDRARPRAGRARALGRVALGADGDRARGVRVGRARRTRGRPRRRPLMDARYMIVPARPHDVPALAAIELAAAALLEGHVPRAVLEEATDEAMLARRRRPGTSGSRSPTTCRSASRTSRCSPRMRRISRSSTSTRRTAVAASAPRSCGPSATGPRGAAMPASRSRPSAPCRGTCPSTRASASRRCRRGEITPALAAVVADEAARGLDVGSRVVMRYQVPVVELPAITGRTRILGLIADPVVQARSPGMATALLREWGQLGAFVLLPMQVPAGALEIVRRRAAQIENFAGAIVSMPHKSSIAALLDELTPRGATGRCGERRAADRRGRLVGTILDGEGFVAGLRVGGTRRRGAGRACWSARAAPRRRSRSRSPRTAARR